MDLDFNYDFSSSNRNRSTKLPSIIIINPHANIRPENTTKSQQQKQIDPLTEIGKVARPLMLNSTASSNITFSGSEDGGVPTTSLPSQDNEKKNAPKLYAQKPYNKTIGKLLKISYSFSGLLYCF